MVKSNPGGAEIGGYARNDDYDGVMPQVVMGSSHRTLLGPNGMTIDWSDGETRSASVQSKPV